MIHLETKYAFNCTPENSEVYYKAITQPNILGEKQKDKNIVEKALIQEKRVRAFGSPSFQAYRLASESTLRLVDEFLEKNGYPKVDRSDFQNMDAYWDNEKSMQSRSPIVSIPQVSKRSGNGEPYDSDDFSVFCSVKVKGTVLQFQYIANQDTWSREYKDFRAALYVTTKGDILCAQKDADKIKKAGF